MTPGHTDHTDLEVYVLPELGELKTDDSMTLVCMLLSTRDHHYHQSMTPGHTEHTDLEVYVIN